MSDSTAPGDPLDRIIADYLQAAEAGRVPSRQALLDAHPEFADDLRAFFADYDRLDNRADALKLATARPPADRPKVRYFGDYELLEEIAEGGMGLVYKARQESLGRIVALKLVRAGRLAKPIDIARFRIEAEAAAGLDHPNIVPLYEVGEHDGQHYLAMKFIDGPSLAKLPRGDLRAEVATMEKVARAVDFAHRQGILHRDLKPSNILTDSAGTPYVTDFGLAKRIDAELSLTESGQMLGTAGYVAPEQALGRKGLTVTADVFSLGAVLFERLTGTPAFPGGTILERLRSLHDEEPPRPSSVCPWLDRDLETVCLKCLEREPAKRYASAGLLADDLAHWLRGEPVVARPRSRLNRAARWLRRHLRAIAVCLGIALLIALGVRLATLSREREVMVSQARDESERQFYYERIASAKREIGRWGFAIADEYLRECPARLRNWEWHYLMRICRAWKGVDRPPAFSAPVVLQGDSRPGLAVIGPGGRQVAAVTGPNTVRVWDATTGRERFALRGIEAAKPNRLAPPYLIESVQPENLVTDLAFSPDGSRIAFVGWDQHYYEFAPGYLVVGDVASGKRLYEKATERYLGRCLAVSPDGRRIAVGGRMPVELFGLASGDRTGFDGEPAAADFDKLSPADKERESEVFSGRSGAMRMTYDPQGRFLALSPFAGPIVVCEASAGVKVATVVQPGTPLRFHYVCPRFSPDGGLLASPVGLPNGGGHNRYDIVVWETKTWTEVARLGEHTDYVPSIAFSPDGSRLASASYDRTVRLWDPRTGHELLNLQGHTDKVLAVAFSPDGHRLLSVGADRTIRTWDATPSPAP